jgi:hypothetical protein
MMTLKKYYANLESITSIDTWDLLKQLNPIEEKINDEYKERIKTERKILAISINSCDLSPKLSTVDSKGEIKSYPDLIDKFHQILK